jgi:cysteine desulfurase
MGYSPAEASSGIRISLGPWLEPEQVLGLPDRLEAALRQVQEQLSASAS